VCQQETVDHLYVNTTKFDQLNAGFDISFPEIPCGLLTLEAAGECSCYCI
jgi:hypothetical protein